MDGSEFFKPKSVYAIKAWSFPVWYLLLLSLFAILSVLSQQKIAEWEITKTEVGNEVEIFIILTKYNTQQQHEEGKPMLVVSTLVSQITPTQ